MSSMGKPVLYTLMISNVCNGLTFMTLFLYDLKHIGIFVAYCNFSLLISQHMHQYLWWAKAVQ